MSIGPPITPTGTPQLALALVFLMIVLVLLCACFLTKKRFKETSRSGDGYNRPPSEVIKSVKKKKIESESGGRARRRDSDS
jgi:hypothetical protein